MRDAQPRRPAVAGMFYEGRREALVRQIEACYLDGAGPGILPTVNEGGPRKIIGLVSPHAGYIYSGPAAAHGMAALARDGRPDVFVIIGPNHRSFADAIQTEGSWATPLGNSPVASAVAGKVMELCPFLEDGADAFAGEHSLEVQLPFLQHLYGIDVQIVPIMMRDQGVEAARRIGTAVREAIAGADAVIVASTDMTHQEPAQVAARQDKILIERMEALDPEGMLRERERRGITMCGYGPVAAMMFAALDLGATSAETLAYTNSGEVGPRSEVVGYLSLVVSRGQ